MDCGNKFYAAHSNATFRLEHGLNNEHIADVTECLLALQVVRETAIKAKLATIYGSPVNFLHQLYLSMLNYQPPTLLAQAATLPVEEQEEEAELRLPATPPEAAKASTAASSGSGAPAKQGPATLLPPPPPPASVPTTGSRRPQNTKELTSGSSQEPAGKRPAEDPAEPQPAKKATIGDQTGAGTVKKEDGSDNNPPDDSTRDTASILQAMQHMEFLATSLLANCSALRGLLGFPAPSGAPQPTTPAGLCTPPGAPAHCTIFTDLAAAGLESDGKWSVFAMTSDDDSFWRTPAPWPEYITAVPPIAADRFPTWAVRQLRSSIRFGRPSHPGETYSFWVPIRSVKKLAASIMLKASSDHVPLSTEETFQVVLRDTDGDAPTSSGGPPWAYEIMRLGPLDGSSANFFVRARQELIRSKTLTHTGAPRQTTRK
jgi:hypothetical protein